LMDVSSVFFAFVDLLVCALVCVFVLLHIILTHSLTHSSHLITSHLILPHLTSPHKLPLTCLCSSLCGVIIVSCFYYFFADNV
jgi:hypothetical protein